MNLQEEYDKIYSFFKKTTEPYDNLEWDGNELNVILNNVVIETFSRENLIKLRLI